MKIFVVFGPNRRKNAVIMRLCFDYFDKRKRKKQEIPFWM